jgi:hypothetical protein
VISRFKPHRPTPALAVSVVALVAAIGGGTALASTVINGQDLKDGSVTHNKLSTNSVWHSNLGHGVVQLGNINKSVTDAINAELGTKADKSATDAALAGKADKPLYESQQGCTPDLCIDAAPGPDGSAGSGGWGWDSSTNAPVTSLANGSTNGLTVTVLQPNAETANGSITLTYDPYDFSYQGNGDSTASCTSASYPAVSCTYTDLAHASKSDTFQFKALHDDPYAVITATAVASGQQASASFPVAITG